MDKKTYQSMMRHMQMSKACEERILEQVALMPETLYSRDQQQEIVTLHSAKIHQPKPHSLLRRGIAAAACVAVAGTASFGVWRTTFSPATNMEDSSTVDSFQLLQESETATPTPLHNVEKATATPSTTADNQVTSNAEIPYDWVRFLWGDDNGHPIQAARERLLQSHCTESHDFSGITAEFLGAFRKSRDSELCFAFKITPTAETAEKLEPMKRNILFQVSHVVSMDGAVYCPPMTSAYTEYREEDGSYLYVGSLTGAAIPNGSEFTIPLYSIPEQEDASVKRMEYGTFTLQFPQNSEEIDAAEEIDTPSTDWLHRVYGDCRTEEDYRIYEMYLKNSNCTSTEDLDGVSAEFLGAFRDYSSSEPYYTLHLAYYLKPDSTEKTEFSIDSANVHIDGKPFSVSGMSEFCEETENGYLFEAEISGVLVSKGTDFTFNLLKDNTNPQSCGTLSLHFPPEADKEADTAGIVVENPEEAYACRISDLQVDGDLGGWELVNPVVYSDGCGMRMTLPFLCSRPVPTADTISYEASTNLHGVASGTASEVILKESNGEIRTFTELSLETGTHIPVSIKVTQTHYPDFTETTIGTISFVVDILNPQAPVLYTANTTLQDTKPENNIGGYFQIQSVDGSPYLLRLHGRSYQYMDMPERLAIELQDGSLVSCYAGSSPFFMGMTHGEFAEMSVFPKIVFDPTQMKGLYYNDSYIPLNVSENPAFYYGN